MRTTTHIDGFVKEAQAALARSYGVGDASRALGGFNRQRPMYSQPRPVAEVTRPDFSATQKTLQPPPVT